MGKKHLYFFPGLGASPKIFEFISLPKEEYELHFLEWKMPLSINESIENYAARMCEDIKESNPILIGVSFGGIMVQEMSKLIAAKKVIIISSIKSHHELPTALRIIRDTKAYKLFPSKMLENIENYAKYFLGDYLKKRAELYKMYLSVRNADYMQWAIYNVLHWKQEKPIKNITHIHGLDDNVFPVKYIDDFIAVEKANHAMILTKAKTISNIIKERTK